MLVQWQCWGGIPTLVQTLAESPRHLYKGQPGALAGADDSMDLG
jgi:hypothetical protein